MMIENIKAYLLCLQKTLCQSIEGYESKHGFRWDPWRSNKGEGITCLLQKGEIFESAGVNFSHVKGDSLPPAAIHQRHELKGRSFEALGVSSVIHPRNPYVPTCHLNVRYFEACIEDQAPIAWFGGGFDLTPFYPFHEDVIHWHQTARRACESFGEKIYPQYKEAADKYFYLPHRQETRGVGGLFFDELSPSTWGWELTKCFEFMKSVGDHFWLAYDPIVQKRVTLPFGDRELTFQRYRRGRYVEFNLVYDRGTLFGLQFGGRTESILMSLPPQVSWEYQWQPQPDSPEAALYQYLIPKNWISEK